MTYEIAYDKITTAYANNNIDPWNPFECFIGVLVDHNCWFLKEHFKEVEDKYSYTFIELCWIETVFMQAIYKNTVSRECRNITDEESRAECQTHPNYQNALFIALIETLDYLKTVHEKQTAKQSIT